MIARAAALLALAAVVALVAVFSFGLSPAAIDRVSTLAPDVVEEALEDDDAFDDEGVHAGGSTAPSGPQPTVDPAAPPLPTAAVQAPTGALTAFAPVRIPAPGVPAGPRRIGLQAGHWLTKEAPPELSVLWSQTGSSYGGYTEWQLNLDIANAVAERLRARGFIADTLPTIIPQGYLADAFIAIHADGDPDGVRSGFKIANNTRRGPHEAKLVQFLREEYGRATGMEWDGAHISGGMRGYYAFAWNRYRWSTAPHTPSVILEMGYMTSGDDRAIMFQRQDLVADAITAGIVRFLDAVPQNAIFTQDLLLQPGRFTIPTPAPTQRP